MIRIFPRKDAKKFPTGDHWKIGRSVDDFAYFVEQAKENGGPFTIADLVPTWMARNSIGAEICDEHLRRDNARAAIAASLLPMVRFRMVAKVTSGFQITPFGFFCFEVLSGKKQASDFRDEFVVPSIEPAPAQAEVYFENVRISKQQPARSVESSRDRHQLKPYHSPWAPRTLHSPE
ncbi:hypothetical protein [Bradyrhizobium huanghuaihaiense]